jgi:hypothetical protein
LSDLDALNAKWNSKWLQEIKSVSPMTTAMLRLD